MNNRQGRILIVDDEPNWREELVETLQEGGFHAEAVPTINQALQRLSNSFFHLLILDIRMDGGYAEGAQPNIDGINFLRILDERRLSRALTIIMLSAYGNTGLMRRAFRGHQVLDFLEKDDFESQRFLQNIREIFATKLQINLQLRIHWEPAHLAGQALHVLEQNGERAKSGRSRKQHLTLELDDLLCRLFNRADSVLVQPLTPGYSGTSVLWVQPSYSPTGIGRPMVIKFGASHIIDKEEHNFADYVKLFIGGGRNTTIENVRYTSRLGGIVYSLLGGDSDRLQDFGAFYRQAEIEYIYEALDNLFFDTCKNWYASRTWKFHDLAADYRPVPKERPEAMEVLNERIEFLQKQQRFRFKALSEQRTFTNPLQAVAGRSFVRPTYVCLNHGDLNERNLLVDRARRCWLIDFETTGYSHYLKDLATLDSVIRYQLLGADEATLKERLEMEEALCGIQDFSEVERLSRAFAPGSPSVAKAYATVIHLRKIACRMAEHSPHDALTEYAISLFYRALGTLGYTTLPIQQREHALLCASLLIDKLDASRT
jgi:CheY-like chemotaxis protein